MPKVVDHGRRRDELARAVLTVLERDGIDAVSVREVAAEAGWSRGVIAHYFTNRDDLLLYAYRLALQREHDIAQERNVDAGPLQALEQVLLRALPMDPESSVDLKIFLAFLGRAADRPALATAVLREHDDYHQHLLRAVEDAVAAGVWRPAVPTRTACELLSVHVDGLGVAATLDPGTYTRDVLVQRVRSFIALLDAGNAPARRTAAGE